MIEMLKAKKAKKADYTGSIVVVEAIGIEELNWNPASGRRRARQNEVQRLVADLPFDPLVVSSMGFTRGGKDFYPKDRPLKYQGTWGAKEEKSFEMVSACSQTAHFTSSKDSCHLLAYQMYRGFGAQEFAPSIGASSIDLHVDFVNVAKTLLD
ncbi:hypothetical protein AMTR_s00077p00196490 [Amborella trichopoda]|uniref:Uncharacterized protein n=1 Tax=Amborella trichopoda TaxID=13333 RepID=W1P9H8_AMBTC|nr:hypothetical protein AMTR_s00077p00196490 [Amborella trichopoda]